MRVNWYILFKTGTQDTEYQMRTSFVIDTRAGIWEKTGIFCLKQVLKIQNTRWELRLSLTRVQVYERKLVYFVKNRYSRYRISDENFFCHWHACRYMRENWYILFKTGTQDTEYQMRTSFVIDTRAGIWEKTGIFCLKQVHKIQNTRWELLLSLTRVQVYERKLVYFV